MTKRGGRGAVGETVDDDEGALLDAELAVHLAGGNTRDLATLRQLAGGGDDWLDAEPSDWRALGWPRRWVRRVAPWRNRVALDHERRRVRRLGARLVGRRSPDWPARLDELPFPPIALSVRGRWPPPERAVAVVGARAATPVGRLTAARLGAAAAGCGVAVLSGLARGVDCAALQAAGDGGGWALGVLGCGLDVVYPPENVGLQEQMAREGTVMSEFPLGTQPGRWTFPRRNRILAALAEVVVVVEAGRRSGALITAGHALEMGREVWAVPGALDCPQAEGTNRLLFDGAQPLVDPASLPEMLGLAAAPDAPAPGDPLLATLGHRALTADELAAETERPAREVRSRLIALELEGRVVRTGGGRWVLR